MQQGKAVMGKTWGQNSGAIGGKAAGKAWGKVWGKQGQVTISLHEGEHGWAGADGYATIGYNGRAM
ncbi:hypothetical protein ACMYR3_04410 [Ampullimonas aquatilis]|uniref:hypothetical protein n=1 Tax=Ampullimonas aquatilis TaxID=1341549 RepID=UPI003C745050